MDTDSHILAEQSVSDAIPSPEAAGTIIEWLRKCGLVFMKGAPPSWVAQNSPTILAYTGGCNAVQAFWVPSHNRWCHTFSGRREYLEPDEIECWMYQPHPSFWPEVEPPADLISDRELYDGTKDVISLLAEAGARPQIVACALK